MKSIVTSLFVILTTFFLTQSGMAQDVRINEVGTTVEFNGSTDWVELHNFGNSMVDLNELWLCIQPSYIKIGSLDVLEGNSDRTIPPGGYLVVEWSTLSDFEGELGLYEEGTVSFGNPTHILDYVQYGSDGNGRDDIADDAGIWTEGTFVEMVEMDQTYSFFDENSDNPVNNWKAGEPTPGAANEEAVATSNESEREIANQFEVVGNFPNPFNPTTTIQFNLPSSATIQVDIYNVTGQKLMSVDAGNFSAGSNRQFSLDASSLASGTYLYRVIANTNSDLLESVGKFTLIK